MSLRSPATRIAGIALAMAFLLLASIAAGAAAKPVADAGAKRVGTACDKRASKAATAAKRRAARQRCLKQTNRTSASRKRSQDVTPPSVAWLAPRAGATVKGSIGGSTCEAAASDERGVKRVVMAVDGAVVNTETGAPWNCKLDSTSVADGAHILTATAYDSAGNASTASVAITVANKPAPDPEPEPEPTPEPEPEPTPVPTPADAAPTVAWKAPTAGATITGLIGDSACEVSAGDDHGVEKVVLKVDGTLLNTEFAAPWDCDFDSTKVSDGTHTLTATAYDTAGNASTASVAVKVANAVAPAPEPAPAPVPQPGAAPLVVGVDGGWGGWNWEETQYRAALGASVTRHEWDPAQSVTAQDALVLKAAAEVRTRIHALLGANELGNATHYREWVVAFIRRYGLGGSFWDAHPELDEARFAITSVELGNEPYFGGMSAALYADTVRPTLEAIKSLGLPVKVILPTRVYGTDTSWMDTLYARIPNLNDYFYGFADHPYWYGHDPAEGTAAGPFGRVEVLRKRMNEKGASAKPIWITEYGQSTANCGSQCVSESVQKEHLQKFLGAAVSRTDWKIGMFLAFQLRDRSTSPTDREHGFGLLRYDGGQKPIYSTVRTLVQEYRG
jgi:hypothetical protein